MNENVSTESHALHLKERVRALEEREREQGALIDALRLGEERFETLIGALQVGIIVVEVPAMVVSLFNPIALDTLGLTKEQLLGKSALDPNWNAIHEDGSPAVPEDFPVVRAVATKAIVRDLVFGIRRPAQKDLVWALATAKPLLARDGTVKQIICTWTDITERKRAEAIARAQASALAELSTPLIPITEDVVVMPLIGVMDSQRAQQVLTTLLSGIGQQRARVAILDITGVSVVDTHVANALIQAAHAVRLLGAEMVLTGIRPNVAQTLVGLGVELTGIVTQGTLQSGIAYALERRWRGGGQGAFGR